MKQLLLLPLSSTSISGKSFEADHGVLGQEVLPFLGGVGVGDGFEEVDCSGLDNLDVQLLLHGVVESLHLHGLRWLLGLRRLVLENAFHGHHVA